MRYLWTHCCICFATQAGAPAWSDGTRTTVFTRSTKTAALAMGANE